MAGKTAAKIETGRFDFKFTKGKERHATQLELFFAARSSMWAKGWTGRIGLPVEVYGASEFSAV
jgi:hypothetical protein